MSILKVKNITNAGLSSFSNLTQKAFLSYPSAMLLSLSWVCASFVAHCSAFAHHSITSIWLGLRMDVICAKQREAVHEAGWKESIYTLHAISPALQDKEQKQPRLYPYL